MKPKPETPYVPKPTGGLIIWKGRAFVAAHLLFVALACVYVWECSSILRAGAFS